MGVRTKLKVTALAQEASTTTALDRAIASLLHKFLADVELGSGTADGEANVVWSVQEQDITDTPSDIDLRGGLTSKQSGQAITFAEIVLICIRNRHATAVLNVGAGSNPVSSMWLAAGDGDKVLPGGFVLKYAPTGYGVVAATADILRLVAATAATIPVDVLIVGRDA